jgi:hypothetical protein
MDLPIEVYRFQKGTSHMGVMKAKPVVDKKCFCLASSQELMGQWTSNAMVSSSLEPT